MKMGPALSSQQTERLSQSGLRLTSATRAVLALFASEPSWSPTHAEVYDRLLQLNQPVHRVTLYRLLDRLSGCGLLSRYHSNDDRAWRFAWVDDSTEGDCSTRFECDACHRQFQLVQAAEPTRAAAEKLLNLLESMGHRGQRVDVAIHGTCAGCETPAD